MYSTQIINAAGRQNSKNERWILIMKKSKLFLALFVCASLTMLPVSLNAETTCEHVFDYFGSHSNATCTSDAYISVKCNICGEMDILPVDNTKLDHLFENYTLYEEATCQKDATEIAYCAYGCGTTDIRTIEGTRTEHKFSTYTSDGNATTESDGTMTALCDFGCGAKSTLPDEGSKLESTGSTESTDNKFVTSDGKLIPVTGDSTNIFVWMLALVVSTGAIIMTLTKKRA